VTYLTARLCIELCNETQVICLLKEVKKYIEVFSSCNF